MSVKKLWLRWGPALLLIGIVFGAPALPAGGGPGEKKEKKLSERELAAKLVEALQSSTPMARFDAIREAGNLIKKEIVEEFAIIGELVRVSQNDGYPRNRAEAVVSLLNLYRKGIDDPQIMITIAKMAEDLKTSLRTRLRILSLLAEMGEDAQAGDLSTKRAFNALENLWKKRKSLELEDKLIARLLEAIGAFHRLKEKPKKILMEALKPKTFLRKRRPVIYPGLLKGLHRYLTRSGITGKNLRRTLLDGLNHTDDRKAGVMFVHCLLALQKNGEEFTLKQSPNLWERLRTMLREGQDEEARAAVLLLVSVADAGIVDEILRAFRRQPRLQLRTLYYFCDALIGALHQLTKEKGEAGAEAAKKISRLFMSVLGPKRTKVKLELKIICVKGFGFWPVTFDRRTIAATLFALIKNDPPPPAALSQEVWSSLEALTGEEFKDIDGENDLKLLEAWLQEHQAELAPRND